MNTIIANMTISEIDKKLEGMREAYPTASGEQKKFMVTGAKLLKEHRLFLINKNDKK